jgi:hypothetical protein
MYLQAVHDFEHRGVSNDFLVKVADPLAIRYNDRSPQENHHAAASFTLLLADEFNFIKGLSLKHRVSSSSWAVTCVTSAVWRHTHWACAGCGHHPQDNTQPPL